MLRGSYRRHLALREGSFKPTKGSVPISNSIGLTYSLESLNSTTLNVPYQALKDAPEASTGEELISPVLLLPRREFLGRENFPHNPEQVALGQPEK